MSFPLRVELFGWSIHPHPVMECLAYTAGFQLFLLLRRRFPRAIVSPEQSVWILVGCIFGALIGSKLLASAEAGALGGKTIVGGLLGGWVGVEIAKKWLGVAHSTGDAFVFPLILGIAVGRVGCFLTGLEDGTYGIKTSLPWAIDFGDGPRHPTQLYEIAFLGLLAALLAHRARRPYAGGELFRLFLFAYLVFRFAVEFIKPTWKPILGLSAIQVVSAIGAMYCAAELWARRTPKAVAGQT